MTATHDEATENFLQSVLEYHASLEPPLIQAVRAMLDARVPLQTIIRLVLTESEK